MPPLPKHRGREATAWMPPPEHRLQPPLVGSGSSGGAMASPEHRLKAPLVGSGFSGGAIARPERRGKGTGSSAGSGGKAAATGSSGEAPLSNLSNLIGSPGFRIMEPPPTATQLQRVARERKHTMPSSSSSPRDPSVRTGQPRRSANTCHRRFSLLPINDAGSPTSQAHLRNTVAAAGSFRDSATTRFCPLVKEKPGTGLSGRRMPSSPSASLRGGRMPRSPSASLSGTRMPSSPCTSLSGARARMPSNPSTRFTVKADGDLSVGTPREHQLASSSPQKHQAVTGSPRKHQAAMSSLHTHLNVTGSNGEKPSKHRSVRGSNPETPQKHQVVLVSNGATLQIDRIKDKVGGGSSGEMAQKSYSKERTRPAHHLSSTWRTGTVTKLQATSAKRLNNNVSFPRKSSLHTNQKLGRRRSSQFDASNGLSLDADHGNTTAVDNKESTAEEDGCLTEEMIRNIQKVDHLIRQLNELGHGEDISYEEFEGYLERLPCMPHVDTSFRPNCEQLNELQLCNILYHIKYCKFTRQKRMNDEMLYKLEDDHPLYHLEEKLECLEEDVSKLEGDNLLYYLEKEGLLRQIENDELFDWSFHYRTIDGLDDYQRLIPQNYGRHEYDRWDTYRDYFHSYEIELEYLMYWKELLKELKWMEDYVLLKRPSLEWGKICTRGCYQAVKIASRFSKITESLAHGAYYDCIDTMCLDIIWYKELDGVYFEIWQRTTKLKENFKDALNEIFKSEKFPLRHQKIKDALENDCSEMENEFRACTAGVTAEVTEDRGRELIADAIKNQRGRPKFYAQYIKKKIEVAKAIGVIPAVVT